MLARIFKSLRTVHGRNDLRFATSSRLVNPWLKRLGYTLIADHFYQPIPNISEIQTYANKERPLSSIQWDLDRQLETTKQLLEQFSPEFNNREILSYYGYSEETSGVCSGDSEFLYSLIRARKPRQIIEIGSGGSTLVISAALRMNYLEGREKASFISIEPYPRDFLESHGIACRDCIDYQLVKGKVQDVDISLFESLHANDVLFVDSSHVYKQGSDVEYEFLQIYPRLQDGVLVHIHDIFFPHDYPVEWNTKAHRYWNEQYYLEVFLLLNKKFDVLSSLSMVADHDGSIFERTIDVYHRHRLPGSFWMKAKAVNA